MNDDVFILAAILVVAVCATVISYIRDSRDETVGQLTTKVANLEAELQAKDAAAAMYQQLLDGERREIELQKKIIYGLKLRNDLKERRIKELTEEKEGLRDE